MHTINVLVNSKKFSSEVNVVAFYKSKVNSCELGDHSQAFLEVWTGHSEGHIYQKSSMSTLASLEGKKLNPFAHHVDNEPQFQYLPMYWRRWCFLQRGTSFLTSSRGLL
jgi:hypothetical protein